MSKFCSPNLYCLLSCALLLDGLDLYLSVNIVTFQYFSTNYFGCPKIQTEV